MPSRPARRIACLLIAGFAAAVERARHPEIAAPLLVHEGGRVLGACPLAREQGGDAAGSRATPCPPATHRTDRRRRSGTALVVLGHPRVKVGERHVAISFTESMLLPACHGMRRVAVRRVAVLCPQSWKNLGGVGSRWMRRP